MNEFGELFFFVLLLPPWVSHEVTRASVAKRSQRLSDRGTAQPDQTQIFRILSDFTIPTNAILNFSEEMLNYVANVWLGSYSNHFRHQFKINPMP